MMSQESSIPGGYILLARKMLESELMNKPPHFLKLWVWMLSKAFWKDGEKLQRGQLHTTVAEMQDVGRYLRGGKMVCRLTEDQVRSAYGYLTKSEAINVTKTTRGLIISINNFDSYQNPDNYRTQTNNGTGTDTGTDTTHKTALPAEIVIKSNQLTRIRTRNKTGTNPAGIDEEGNNYKTSCASPPSKRPPSGDHQTFIAWWSYAYELTQGKPYLTTGKDFKPVKELLATYGLKPLIIMACWFLIDSDTWIASKRDITMFKSQINRIPGYKDERHNDAAYRTAGILPPKGIMLENWHFWQQDEQQEALAL